MSVVVTGASGFVGSALLRCLHRRGIPALGVSRRAVEGLLQVSTYADTPCAHTLVHLAEESVRSRASDGGQPYVDEALETLRALLDKGYARVVYASSAALYGDRESRPRSPGEPIVAHDAYTQLKAASEAAVLSAGHAVARLANVYGPGMSMQTVVGAILSQLGGTADIVVQDDSPVRDFVWVDDAAEALACLAAGRPTGVFNVGSGVGTSVRQLASLILRASHQPHRRIVSRSRATGEPSTLVLDIRATLAEFDWRPTTSLDQGLRLMLQALPPQ